MRRRVPQGLLRAAAHGEEEIKTKIDLSHISRPGDVLRAITAKGSRRASSARLRCQAAGCASRRLEAKPKLPLLQRHLMPKAVPPKPATERCRLPPAPRIGDAGFRGRDLPPAVGGRDSAQSSRQPPPRTNAGYRYRPPALRPPAIAVPPRMSRLRQHRSAARRRRPSRRRTSTEMQSAAPAKTAAPIAPPPRMIMPQTGPRPVYKAPRPAPGAPARRRRFAARARTPRARTADFSAYRAAAAPGRRVRRFVPVNGDRCIPRALRPPERVRSA